MDRSFEGSRTSGGQQFTHELTVAFTLAVAAGKAAMAFYGTTDHELKGGGSPVTEADHASNRLILEGLRRSFRDDPVLSEESPDPSARLGSERVWIVDPLDGTKEFLAQNGEFGIMIGLIVDREPRVGVVYLPATDVLYGGVVGEGVWVERNGTRTPVHLDGRRSPPRRMVVSRSHPDPRVTRIQRALDISESIPCGSVGVKCIRILEGAADLYVHPVAYLHEWDTCAPEVLIRAAGGQVTDCLGERLRYNKLNPVHPDGILVQATPSATTVLKVASVYRAAREGAERQGEA
jgi:3'(2'), 5'-bisphosphate nucleotidase